MQINWLPPDTRHEKIFGLDAFRGLAALLVFLFHYWTFYLLDQPVTVWKIPLTDIFAAGHLGVDIFFVLSGFLVFLSLVRSSSVQSYWRKRLLRIVPLAWFCTVTIFAYQYVVNNANWWDFWSHILFLQSFFENTYHSINPVMWTISVEMAFYLVLPILVWLGRRKLWHFLGILCMLAILNFWYRSQLFGELETMSTFQRIFSAEQLWGRFDQFVMGISLGLLWIFRGKVRSFFQYWSPLLLLLGLGGFLWSMHLFRISGSDFREIWWMQVFLHSLVGLSFSIFLFGFLFTPRIVQKITAPKPLEWLGVISYSVYLWHFLIIQLVYTKITEDAVNGFLIAFLGTVALSTLTYFAVERPFLRKKTGPHLSEHTAP